MIDKKLKPYYNRYVIFPKQIQVVMPGRHVKELLWVWCILPHLLLCCTAYALEPYLNITGHIKYCAGDNLSWSLPSYNDTSWKKIDKPTIAEKMFPRNIAWYRIHFRFPEQGMKEPALLINPSSGADEIFLNGVKIGGEGTVGDRFIGAPKSERLCRIPAGLIKAQRENILALRVMATHLEEDRFAGGIRAGEYHELRMEMLERNSSLKKAEVFNLFFMLVPMIPYFIMLINRTSYEKGMEYFGYFLILYNTAYFLGSLVFYETGMKTHILERIQLSFLALLPVAMPVLLTYFIRAKISFYLKIVAACAIAMSFVILLFFNQNIYLLTAFAWSFLVLTCSIESLRLMIKGYRRRIPQAGFMLMGTAGLVSAGVISAAEAINIMRPIRIFHESVTALGGPCFVFFRLIGIAQWMIETRGSQLSLSKRILTAHEEERMRLARELHDGLGQSLLAVKLALQVIEAKARKDVKIEGEKLTGLVSEISHTIEELRRISMDLRPASFEGVNIDELVMWYGMKCQSDAGIKVTVKTDTAIIVSPKIKDHLYRVYQEILANAIKHANASEIQVDLRNPGGILSLEVKDNGKGFIFQNQDKKTKGIGLSTIKERVELLDGNVRIDSSPGKGTIINIEVPNK